MNLDEATELRELLAAIEATMHRIRDLWMSDDFPSLDNLEDLNSGTLRLTSAMHAINEKAEEMPSIREAAARELKPVIKAHKELIKELKKRFNKRIEETRHAYDPQS